MGKLLPSTDARLSAEYFLEPGFVETLTNEPRRSFPPVGYFGGQAPSGPSVLGRIDPNDDMQANRGATLGGHEMQPQFTSQPARSRGSAPSRLLSGQKSLGLKTQHTTASARPDRPNVRSKSPF
jgi:hypothetical protein